jgi:hypothetical protein
MPLTREPHRDRTCKSQSRRSLNRYRRCAQKNHHRLAVSHEAKFLTMRHFFLLDSTAKQKVTQRVKEELQGVPTITKTMICVLGRKIKIRTCLCKKVSAGQQKTNNSRLK